MNKSFKKFLLSAIIAGTSLSAFASGPDVSGYFDMAFLAPKGKSSYFRQQHLNLILQHQVDKFKFFSELEFEDAVDINMGRTTTQTGTNASNAVGRLYMERAYGEMAITRYDTLRMGQMLSPTYYYLNHYPSIIVNYTNPLTFKSLINYNNLGVELFGSRKGISYSIWSGKGPVSQTTVDHESGNDLGAKIGYTYSSRAVEWTFNVMGANYYLGDTSSNGTAKKSDTALVGEFIMNYGNFILWSEFGTRTMKASTTTNSNSRTVYHFIGSYSIPVGKQGELLPFFMIDGYKQKEASSNITTEAVRRTTIGVTYHPVPVISWKLEYVNGGSYAPKSSSGALVNVGNQKIQDTVVAQFIYFYN